MNERGTRNEQGVSTIHRGPVPEKLTNPDKIFEQSILLCPQSKSGKIFIRWNTDLNCFDTS